MPFEIDRLSKEDAWWRVNTVQNITNSPVHMAFTPVAGRPADGDETQWVQVSIVNEGTPEAPVWWVYRLMSGPNQGGETELPVGDYQAWIRITDTRERPVRKTGVVSIL
jgi:hypothetical protein